MNKTEYLLLVKNRENTSPILKNAVLAFVGGGLVCLCGRFFSDLYLLAGADEKLSATLSSVTLIFLAGLSTGIGFFDKAARICGAGLFVPITGFSNAVTAPAIEAKSEGFIMGVGAEIFKIAGPVIVYGNITAALYGIFYYLYLCITG